MASLVEQLDHTDDTVARQIHRVFQRSYRVEAELIGVEDFPPLRRTADDLRQADAIFFGCWEDADLAAVVEVTLDAGEIDINSLVVDPDFFRRGLASRLLQFVLTSLDWETAVVETAVVNEPAITLYKKFDFVEEKRWVPSHGIPKIQLRRAR